MDISGKFIVSIVGVLIAIFLISSVINLKFQENYFNNFLNFSVDMVDNIVDKNTENSREKEKSKITQLVKILKEISAGPVADIEVSLLDSYGRVIIQDDNISYVEFSDMDGNMLSKFGDMSSLPPERIVTEALTIEDLKLGSVTVGFNFDQSDRYEETVNAEKINNFKKMGEEVESAMNYTKLSFSLIAVFTCLAIAVLIAYLFRLLAIKRLEELEFRIQNIAQEGGDLSSRVVVKQDDIIGRIGGSLNQLLDKLQNTIKKIADTTELLTEASRHMQGVTTGQSKDIANQKDQLNLSAVAVNQTAATTQEVATNATTAADAAKSAEEEASKGLSIVTQSINAANNLAQEVRRASQVVKTLEDDSSEIGTVLGVIRSVSEQTNLLALNAAIEAARAGEQGRGFAVVADEVRTLASRTQSSTEEIQKMIEKLRVGTENVVNAMKSETTLAESSVECAEKTGQSLQVISKSVEVIAHMNLQIASGAEEQRSVSEEMSSNITSINDSAENLVIGSDQMVTSISDLNNIVGELETLVRSF